MMICVENSKSITEGGSVRLAENGFKSKRGSITVEASIVIPLIIISIASAIYMGLLLYQRALVQSAAEAAAEAGAIAWASGAIEMGSKSPADECFKDFKLYRRLFDGEKESRLDNIRQYALEMAGRNEIVKPLSSEAEVIITDYVVYRKLAVKISKKYFLPLGKFLKMFGGSDTFTINVSAVSTIDEPVELIRTTDFIIDIERKLESKYPGLKNLGDKSRKAMNEIKDKIGEFMN